MVLERLLVPIATAAPTLAVQTQIQILKTQKDIQQALEDLGSVAQKVTKKIGKAAMIFHARAVLAEKESQELIEETKKIQEAASRKRKKVPGKGPQLVGAVLESVEQQKKRGCRVTRRSSSVIEVKTAEEDLEDSEDSDSSDLSDCIVIVYDN
ncbi:MAG: hypothetical protein M1840_001533 [Geoglossum simile]|nr:MAG: hypothetical protein M1840_001533 [Geoglossum simile]